MPWFALDFRHDHEQTPATGMDLPMQPCGPQSRANASERVEPNAWKEFR
jgi:hypothetical protein